MKRVGNIFEKICDIENINTAIKNAARGKKSRKTVAYVLNNQEKAASLIQEMLVNKTYKPKPYVNIKELKEVISNESRKHNKTEVVQR